MTTTSTEQQLIISQSRRYWYLGILALSRFVTSFGAHIVATNLPAYAETVGAGAFMIGLLIGVYDFAELFAKPVAGFLAHTYGFAMIFVASAVVGVLALLLSLALPRDRDEGAELDDDDDISLRQFFAIFKAPRLLTQFFGVRIGFVTCGGLALLFLVVLARSRTLGTVHAR